MGITSLRRIGLSKTRCKRITDSNLTGHTGHDIHLHHRGKGIGYAELPRICAGVWEWPGKHRTQLRGGHVTGLKCFPEDTLPGDIAGQVERVCVDPVHTGTVMTSRCTLPSVLLEENARKK